MACASCVTRVERARRQVPGQSRATGNLATGQASIQALSTVPVMVLQAAVDKAGDAAEDVLDTPPQPAARIPAWWPVATSGVCTLALVLPMLLQPLGIDWMLDGWAQLASRWCCWASGWSSAPGGRRQTPAGH